MPTKPNAKNWDDIKMLLAALSIAATLGLWNVFAVPGKGSVASQTAAKLPEPVAAVQPTIFQGKILLGGKSPIRPVITAQNTSKKRSGGNNGAQAPAPVTNTRSS